MSNYDRLTKKGWAQMSALLDEEMPQQKPQRPVVLWLAVSVCAIGTAVWLLWPHHGTKAQQEHAQDQQLQSPVSSSGPSNKPKHPTSAALTGSAATAASTVSSLLPLNVHIQQPQQMGRQHSIQHIATDGAEHLNGNESQSIQDVELNLLKFTPMFVQPENKVPSIQPSPKAVELAALPQSGPTLEHKRPKHHPERVPVRLNPKMKPQRIALSFGLLTGFSAFQVRNNPGLHLGLTTNLDFVRQRFGLQSGLLYRYQQYDKHARPVIPITYKAYADATGNKDVGQSQAPNSWLYLSNNNRIILPITKSHQLEIPALTYLRLGNRWRFYGGMTFLRHVWVESSSAGLFTYNLKVVTTPEDGDAQGNLNTLITGQLPRWEKNWQTGLSFQPFERFELGIYYRSVWRGMPVLSDFYDLFDTCVTCDSKYPKARENTLSAIRPQAFQFNLYYKF
jgi:hypothetical protein